MNKLLILVLLFSSSCSLAMEKYEKADLRKISLLITEIKHIGKHSNDDYISYYALREKDTVEATLILTGTHKGEYYGTLTYPAEGGLFWRALKGRQSFNRLKCLYETYSQSNQN